MNILEEEVIVEQQSTNNAAIWPVVKAEGKTWRLTINLRPLNKVTPMTSPVGAKYPEVIASIMGGVWGFTVLDLANAFFAIPLHPDSWYKFAFKFQGLQFCFTQPPQGFQNSPAICHMDVNKMPNKDSIISYVDDILISTKTKEENLEIFDQVTENKRKRV